MYKDKLPTFLRHFFLKVYSYTNLPEELYILFRILQTPTDKIREEDKEEEEGWGK